MRCVPKMSIFHCLPFLKKMSSMYIMRLLEISLHFQKIYLYDRGFLKWWYPTTMGFPTKNNHFGVFWGYHHLRKHPYVYIYIYIIHYICNIPVDLASQNPEPCPLDAFSLPPCDVARKAPEVNPSMEFTSEVGKPLINKQSPCVPNGSEWSSHQKILGCPVGS